ncbi:MAG: hypothetical protein QM820_21770 [Minicystis sp.]
MLKPSLAASFALLLLSAAPLGCMATVEEAPPPHAARHGGGGVPFHGVFAKFAEGTFKNGRRVRMANSNGAATIRIDHGHVTYDQTYVSHGNLKRVIQSYAFSPGDVRRMGGSDFEVFLTFRGMSGDTYGYSPDRIDPKLEARRVGGGWEISLFTTDNNGVIGVVEFQ